MRISILAIVLCLATTVGTASADELSLICSGVGARDSVERSSGFAVGSSGQSASGSGVTTRRESFAESVLVEVNDSEGRIFFPSSLLPQVHGSSDAGWRPLERLNVTDDRISGRFSLNFLNKPTVEIDRRTGTIEIDGFSSTSFSGVCERAPEQATRRF